MCKILTIINTKPENNAILQDIITANIPLLKTERSGYSVLRKDKAEYFLGQADYDNFEANTKYNGESTFIIHTRTSTGGDSDKKGLHLQKYGNWFWGHNGIVSGFSQVKDYSDSYYFFMSLLSQKQIGGVDNFIPKATVEQACQELGFSGKGVIYNSKSDILQWFCNIGSSVYILDGCIILTSYDLSLTVTDYTTTKMLGFEWISSSESRVIEVLHKEKIDDLMLTFHKNILVGRESVVTRKPYNYQQPTKPTTIVLKDSKPKLTKKQRRELKFWENKLKKQNSGDVILTDGYGRPIIKDVYDDERY